MPIVRKGSTYRFRRGMGQAAAQQAWNKSVQTAAGCAANGGTWEGNMCEFWPSSSPTGFQSNSASCQYQLQGVPLLPGIPVCPPSGPTVTGVACGGMPPGAPGYAACVQAQGQTESEIADFNSPGGGVPTTVAPAPTLTAPGAINFATTTPPSAPAQSNAPNSTYIGTPGVPAQSNAPATSYAVPASAPAAAGCFALFGSEPCVGPIGLYTLLAGAAAAIAAMALFGGHR